MLISKYWSGGISKPIYDLKDMASKENNMLHFEWEFTVT